MMSKCTRNLPTAEPCAGHCGECARRAEAGPNYNPERGTRRTSDAVKAAVLAAATGQRVVYMSGNQSSADHASSLARDFVKTALGKCAPDVSMSKERITFYYASGKVIGTLVFRSIAARDINIGLRGEQVFSVVEDHTVTEVLQERENQRRRVEAMGTIRTTMREHGIKSVKLDDDLTGRTGVPTYTFT